MNNKELLKNMNQHANQMCLILKPNKYANYLGFAKKAEMVDGKAGMLVELENGEEIHIFNNEEIMFLLGKPI